MPAYLWQEAARPWRSSSWLRLKRFLDSQIGVQAILDHQEFMGKELGRKRILPIVSGARDVWDEHHGFCCNDPDIMVKFG